MGLLIQLLPKDKSVSATCWCLMVLTEATWANPTHCGSRPGKIEAGLSVGCWGLWSNMAGVSGNKGNQRDSSHPAKHRVNALFKEFSSRSWL